MGVMVVDESIYLTMAKDPVDDFLAHFGIKGMRWGIRNKSKSVAPTTVKEERKQIRKSSTITRNNKILAGGAASLSVGVGALFLTQKLTRKHFDEPVPMFVGTAAALAGAALTSKLLDNHGEKKVKTLY